MPCLLYAGESDRFFNGLKEDTKHTTEASFISIPGLEYWEVFYCCGLILLYAKRSFQRVSRYFLPH